MSLFVNSIDNLMNILDIEKILKLDFAINSLSASFAILAGSFLLVEPASLSLLAFATGVRLSLTDGVIEKLSQTALAINRNS